MNVAARNPADRAAAATDSRYARRWIRALVALWLLVLAAAVVARSLRTELASVSPGGAWFAAQLVSLLLTLGGAMWLVWGMPRAAARLGTDALTTIGLFSAAYFAVSFLATVAGSVLFALTGPAAVFVTGIGDALLLCLIKAVLVVLLPRPGTLTVSLVASMGLSAVCTGTLGVASLVFIAISVAAHEGLAAATGLTTSPLLRRPAARAPWPAVCLVAMAIAVADGLKLWCQFAVFHAFYRLQFDAWYVLAVVLITGVGYGAVGAALGALVGYRLRRISP